MIATDSNPRRVLRNELFQREIQTIQPYVLICLLSFVGHFLFFSLFGLYEDDYLFTLPVFGAKFDMVVGGVKNVILTWPQGRPVGYALSSIWNFWVTRGHSLAPAYFAGFLLVGLNGCLFYRFARRLIDYRFAFLASCVFVLYPLDCSKQLIHDVPFGLLSMSFLLLAFLNYQSSRILVSYSFATLSFLTYEHFFMPFVAAPFFVPPGKKVSARRIVLHGFFFLGVPLLVMLVRRLLGEARAQSVLRDPWQVLNKSELAVPIGLWNSLSTTLWRVYDFFAYGDSICWGVFITILIVLLLAIGRSFPYSDSSIENGQSSARQLFFVSAGSLAAWAVGYVLAFLPETYPPTVNLGRMSNFNAPGSVGFALFFGCALSLLVKWNSRLRSAITLISCVFVAALVALGVYVQRVDYVESWKQQKAILRALVATYDQWTPDTHIIIDLDHSDPKVLQTPGFRGGWLLGGSIDVLRYLVASDSLPLRISASGVAQYPTVHGFARFISTETRGREVKILSPGWNLPKCPTLRDGNFLLFKLTQTGLERIRGDFQIGGVTLAQQAQVSSPMVLHLSRAGLVLLGNQKFWPAIQAGSPFPGFGPLPFSTGSE